MSTEIPKESGVGVIAGYGKPYLVCIRKSWPIKEEAKQLDGKIFIFRDGWKIDKEDSTMYEGETAMVPNDFDWPADAPAWVASGDLHLIDA